MSAVERIIFGKRILGSDVGPKSECAHYHSELDIVAIRFKCCDTYFPCHRCHEALAGHSASVWPESEFDEKAVLCGACGTELKIHEYLGCNSRCPACGAAFNPGCKAHSSLYFAR